jgi:homoserine dehydrogenase
MDKPGVLAKIATILAKHDISISTVVQTPEKDGKVVSVVMLLHKAKEQNMVNALKEINKLTVSKKKPVMIRIED